MNDNDTELLSRHIDGELNDSEATALQRRLQSEPELLAALQSMRAVNDRVRDAFEYTAVAPARVTSLLEKSAGNVVAFPSRDRAAGWGFAIAASVMAAAGLLMFQTSGQLTGDYAEQDAQFAELIDKGASRGAGWDTLDDGSRFRPVLSFKTNNGKWCREYLLESGTSAGRGVACLDNGNWVTQVFSAQAAPGTQTEYRPAGAVDADAVAQFVADHASHIALGAEEEAEVIAGGWQ